MLSKEATGLLAERFPRVFCLWPRRSIPPSPPRRPLIWRQQTSPAIDALDKTFVYDWAGRPAADQHSLTNGSHRLLSPVWQFVAGAQLAGHVVRPVAFKERRWITIGRCHPPARFLLSHTETTLPGSFMPDRLLVFTRDRSVLIFFGKPW